MVTKMADISSDFDKMVLYKIKLIILLKNEMFYHKAAWVAWFGCVCCHGVVIFDLSIL